MRTICFFTVILLFSLFTFVYADTIPSKSTDLEFISTVFSPDSSILAINTPKGVHLYDAISLIEITFIETLAPITTNSFSPDGNLLAFGDNSNDLIIWDVKNRMELATLVGHKSRVSCICFSSDGNLLATGSEDGMVKLWDAKTRLSIANFEGHTSKIISLNFSQNGKFLISVSTDNTLKLWDPKSYMELATLKGTIDWTLSPNYVPDMTLVSKRRTFRETLKLSDLRLSSPSIIAGDTTTIEALSLYSGDETALSHSWSASAGFIQGEGNKATYMAPRESGVYSVNVKATDGMVSSERTAEIDVKQGTPEASILICRNTYFPAKTMKDKLTFNITVNKIPGTKVLLHYDITQDKDKFDTFLSIEINQKFVLQDMAIGNEQPSTGVRTNRDLDVTNVITKPGQYTITFYIRPGDRTENGWLMNEAKLIGVDGSI
ncbi:TPA: hypothetical protein ENS27_03200 [bacterium]|nr:hypothetical protein [bacterium]